MFRQASIFAVFLLICILIIDSASGRMGGYSTVPLEKLNDLKPKLQSSNFQSALKSTGSGIKIQKINSASKQVVAGMNYRIKANVLVNGKSKECCFAVHEGLPQNGGKQRFNVKCAQCGGCECFH